MQTSDWIGIGALGVSVLNGVLLFARTGRTDAQAEGGLSQRVTDLEKRAGKLEVDVQATERSVADIRVTLATIPEQLKSQKELMTLQFDSVNHGLKNLRMAVEALAREKPKGSA